MPVINLTEKNFNDEVMNSEVPVLIDFFATWCGPCMMVSPIVDEIAEEVSDKKICKVNVDEQPELAKQFQVYSIPTLVVVKNGEVAQKNVGALPKEDILEMFN